MYKPFSGQWLKDKLIPIIGLIFVIIITSGIFFFYRAHPDLAHELQEYGYLGAFIISTVFNATLILPVGNILILTALGATLPSPVLVGLVGGIGAAIGESVGYIAGHSGRSLISRQQLYGRVEGWVRKWGFLGIFVFSLAPLIFDLVGIAAGALRVPYWKFFLSCWLGRTTLYIIFIWLAAMGIKSLLPWFI
jgi:membrane protein YqaA with SNARE-associated domain